MGHSDICMANVYLYTKFGANRSINGRYILLFLFFQDGGRPPSWILEEVGFWYVVTLAWPISSCTQNLVQIGQEMAEIYLFMYFPVSYTHLTLPTIYSV